MDPTPVIYDLLFNKGLLGVFLGLMILCFCIQGWYFRKLLSGEPEKHKPVFDKAKSLIKSEHWGTRYRVFLKKLLAELTRVIGDHHRFPNELPEKPRLKAGDPKFEQLHKQDTLRRIFGVNPFTVESYQFCFLLGLIYPILSFMMGWGIGGNGSLADLQVLPSDQPFYIRLGLMLLLLLSVSLAFRGIKQSSWKLAVGTLIGFLAALTFAIFYFGAFSIVFVGAGAVVLAGAVSAGFTKAKVIAGAAAASGAVAVVGSVSMDVTSSLALPWYFELPLMFGLAACTISFYDKAYQTNNLAVYWFLYSLVFLTVSLAVLNWIESTSEVLTLLFYLILPLVNTPLDWLSLGITRALLQSIRFNQHRVYKALIWSLLDLLMAVVALLLVSGVTVGVVSLANLLAVKPIIDLASLFKSLSLLENWKDNLWIYFMLLSTLIPTVVHFALAGGALTLAVSKKKRRDTLMDFETNNLSANKAWLYVSLMPAFGFVLAPTLLLSGLYWLLHAHGAMLGDGLLAWAEMLATWIDPSLGQLPKM